MRQMKYHKQIDAEDHEEFGSFDSETEYSSNASDDENAGDVSDTDNELPPIYPYIFKTSGNNIIYNLFNLLNKCNCVICLKVKKEN